MKTLVLKAEEVQPKWWLVDATDLPVGRLASRLAMILMGKHNPSYTPHVLCGDCVVVVNAAKVKFTGKKWEQKTYTKYTGYPSGQRHAKAADMRETHPDFIIRQAVKRMLPKSKLAYSMITRLKVYGGAEHQQQAQQPQPLTIPLRGAK